MWIVGGQEPLQQVFLLPQQLLIGLTGTLHERCSLLYDQKERVNSVVVCVIG
jgi:hypothetical protein